MSTSLSREEIEEVSSTESSGFVLWGEVMIPNTQKQNMVISKSVQVLSMLSPVPLLQGQGLIWPKPFSRSTTRSLTHW